MWIPAVYLVVVVGLLVCVDVLVRTGDGGFAGIWPMPATAPLGILALWLIVPDPEPVGTPEATPPVHTGPVPPPEPQPEPVPEGPPPTDSGAYDLPGAELSDMWLGFGFYGVILACALVNATALWVLVHGLTALLARRRHATGQA
ncbi:hypothetical protein OG756_10920 [Streptomyces sp. NBC_01310]|uniref:SCO4225 family membrane protein n=1 Tax=Streptomyces sp. NBC_01310 TaxID=2903820 RepID=UPI0035B5B26A|nr:hypothetical protein OG756_10920 [Streptomyces sp. NBC_01310]